MKGGEGDGRRMSLYVQNPVKYANLAGSLLIAPLKKEKSDSGLFLKKKHDAFFPLFVVGLVVTIRAQLEMSNLSHPSNL